MAHTLLFSGYGAPGCDDLAVCRLTADGTLETLSTLRHGRAPSFCCRGQNGWIYAASERGDGADVTAYVLDGTTLREIARIEIPTGRGLCHLYGHYYFDQHLQCSALYGRLRFVGRQERGVISIRN